MKKGFTLIELLSVLGIMAILLLIAVPTYVTISQNIKERMYQAKVREILAKGESYAEETNNYAFLVNRLLEEGKISADDESGNIYDPRDKRKMNCDLIEISYQDNQRVGIHGKGKRNFASKIRFERRSGASDFGYALEEPCQTRSGQARRGTCISRKTDCAVRSDSGIQAQTAHNRKRRIACNKESSQLRAYDGHYER